MKLKDLFEARRLNTPDAHDNAATEMDYPLYLLPKNRGIGKKTSFKNKKVVVKSSKDGTIYSDRTIASK